MKPSVVYLGLGTNLGNREENLNGAINELQKQGIAVIKVSAFRETDPEGGPPQGKFLNCVACIHTTQSPHELLKSLHRIEKKFGRVRREINGPRTLDLDILLYDQLNISSPDLTIPHPRMLQRKFVLDPLKEIAPQLVEELARAHH